jgi:PTH2 family peptidyl-tRNA hydrolase
MYLFLNRGLGMSMGKACAQVAHAAVEAARISDPKMVDTWNSGGHYTKIILTAEDEAQITTIKEYLETRGFDTSMIIDEGRTEIKPFSKTALGVAIVDKADQHVQDTFSGFELYKELPRPVDVSVAYQTVAAHGHLNRKGKIEYRRYFPHG